MSVIREDMLAYTRKMKIDKHCYSKICTMTYNNGKITNYKSDFFDSLTEADQTNILNKIKTVPFSKSLKEITLTGDSVSKSKTKLFFEANQLLKASVDSELTNDAITQLIPIALDQIYCSMSGKWDIIVVHGTFNVPTKRVFEQGSSYEPESEDVYNHIIVYMTNGSLEKGIMYPAYERASLIDTMDAVC